MNVKRGLIRLWVLFSVVWGLCFLGLSARDWYHVASYWCRSRGIEVTQASRCPDQDIAKRPGLVPPPAGDELPPWERYKEAAAQDCFHVTLENGAKYFVVTGKGEWGSAEKIRDVVLYNPQLFPRSYVDNPTPPGSIGGYGKDPQVVDLTSHSNPLPDTGGWLRIGGPYDHPDVEVAKIFTILAFAVPIGVLGVGRGIWWAAMGFKA